jgi:hypothetical protein
VSALGPRAVTVLAIAGFAGLFLGILGWTQRGTGLVTPLITAPPSTSASSSTPASPSTSASPATAASPGTSATAAAAGPLLTSEPYASYAYQVWPGPLTADGRLALTGFDLTVSRQATGIAVSATQDGQKMTSASHFYPGGVKVFVLDSNLGDDGGGNVDYDETDDGLIVTNAQGEVLP